MQALPDFIVRWSEKQLLKPNMLIQKSDTVEINAESFAAQKVVYLEGYNALVKYIQLAAEEAGEKPTKQVIITAVDR